MAEPFTETLGKDVEAQKSHDESQRLQRGQALHSEPGTYGTLQRRDSLESEASPGASPEEPTVKSRLDEVKEAVRRRIVSKQFAVQDAMTYHTEDLSSWNSLWHMSFTVWNRASLWLVTLKLFALSFVVGLLVLVTVTDPAHLRVGEFRKITNFLRVFVGLLLGFFMAASVNRWWSCATAFQHICSAVRNLHIYFNSCGVPDEQTKQCLRYGVVSAWILHMQLHIEAMPHEEQEAAVKNGWDDIKSGEGRDSVLGTLLPEELDVLHEVSDPPGTLWMWIGSIIGSMAQDGVIPAIASPTYGRIMGTCVEGFNAIRDVRSGISMQAPFIYVQMLSSLVHINNIVNAISFGLTWGAAVGTLMVHLRLHWFVPNASPKHAEASERQATTDMQSLMVSFFFSCFGPFVYQALLEVSIAIAQPFSNKDAVVPTHRIIKVLERDLNDALWAAKQISWKQPYFKKPEQ